MSRFNPGQVALSILLAQRLQRFSRPSGKWLRHYVADDEHDEDLKVDVRPTNLAFPHQLFVSTCGATNSKYTTPLCHWRPPSRICRLCPPQKDKNTAADWLIVLNNSKIVVNRNERATKRV